MALLEGDVGLPLGRRFAACPVTCALLLLLLLSSNASECELRCALPTLPAMLTWTLPKEPPKPAAPPSPLTLRLGLNGTAVSRGFRGSTLGEERPSWLASWPNRTPL